MTVEAITGAWQVIGPPGTGKTTFLANQAARASSVFGGADVVICSMTRTAAAAVRAKDVAIPDRNIGTLHSMAFRALGAVTIAETKLAEWNDAARPEHRMTVARAGKDSVDPLTEPGAALLGDVLYERMQILRQQMVDATSDAPVLLDRWGQNVNADVRAFARAWSGWLRETGYLDFTGLIEACLRDVDACPGNPSALFVDEAQDLSALEAELVVKWGAKATHVIVVGDPAQALYEWRGSEAGAFSRVIINDPSKRRVLAQSYRVPRAVHRVATAWAGDLLNGVTYRPTAEEGRVEEASLDWSAPDTIMPLIEEHLSDPESGRIMIQASCAMFLEPLIRRLRADGIGYGNPYRVERGDWNPLATRGENAVSTKDRVAAYLSEEPTAERIALWLPLIKAKGVLARGVKARIQGGWQPRTLGDVLSCFVDSAVAEQALSRSPDWLMANTDEKLANHLGYLLQVHRRGGVFAMEDSPRVLLGTIHSFKGAEADHVVVLPDLSRRGFLEWCDGARRAAIRRAFYVAMTRSKHRLTLGLPTRGFTRRQRFNVGRLHVL